MNCWLRRLLWLLAGFAAGQFLMRMWVLLRPWPTPMMFAPLLRSAPRRRYRDPARTLTPLGLAPGMRVLELGPGTGLFTAEAARRVAPGGHLVALDIQPAMLRELGARLAGKQVAPQLLAGDAANMPLAPACFDAAFLIAVLPMIPDRHGALQELRRVLRPGAIVLMSEEIMAPEYVPPPVTERWLRHAGFTQRGRISGFWCYSVLAQRPE